MINTEKSYAQLMLEAASMTENNMEVGDVLPKLMKQLKDLIEDCVQKQYESCEEKGFTLPKYYIHVFMTKEEHAAKIYGTPNVMRIRKPHCRVTRPSPYQEEDHYLWSVTNMNQIKFEWCIPKKSIVKYILANPHEFDINYVRMLKLYTFGSLDKIEDYLVDGGIA
jgi:hypothetical protein